MRTHGSCKPGHSTASCQYIYGGSSGYAGGSSLRVHSIVLLLIAALGSQIAPTLAEPQQLWQPTEAISDVPLSGQITRTSGSPEGSWSDVVVGTSELAGLPELRPAPVAALRPDPATLLSPGKGQPFRDTFADGQRCAFCPEMVVVPAGSAMVGAAPSEPHRESGEEQVVVTIGRPFAVARFAVTFDEWDACVSAGGCNGYAPYDEGWGRANRPVINVNLYDAKAYIAWLSQTTGRKYRLLSEAEREYVARAGTRSAFWWGDFPERHRANHRGLNEHVELAGQGGGSRWGTVPVDRFEANPWGLYQVHGNVWEWTEDCWNDSTAGITRDGGARTVGDCSGRVVRGGSWLSALGSLRAASRGGFGAGDQSWILGFRVAREISYGRNDK